MTPSRVQCIDCTRFSLRGHKGMASQDYGQCDMTKDAWHFESATFERRCVGFDPVPPETSKQRRDWLNDRRDTFNQSIDRS